MFIYLTWMSNWNLIFTKKQDYHVSCLAKTSKDEGLQLISRTFMLKPKAFSCKLSGYEEDIAGQVLTAFPETWKYVGNGDSRQ